MTTARVKLGQTDADKVIELERIISQGVTQLYNMTTTTRSVSEVIYQVTQAREALREMADGMAQAFEIPGNVTIQRDIVDGKHYLVWEI